MNTKWNTSSTNIICKSLFLLLNQNLNNYPIHITKDLHYPQNLVQLHLSSVSIWQCATCISFERLQCVTEGKQPNIYLSFKVHNSQRHQEIGDSIVVITESSLEVVMRFIILHVAEWMWSIFQNINTEKTVNFVRGLILRWILEKLAFEDNNWNWPCNTHRLMLGVLSKCILNVWFENPVERGYLWDQDTDGRIILKSLWWKWSVRVQNEVNYIVAVSKGGP